MRIVGGKYRGHTINAPKGMATRPTTDRTRESLFNILAHHEDAPLERARVIDLFAGSGALGLESMSRGARFCLFVETAAAARAVIRDSIEALHLFGHTALHRRSAIDLGQRTSNLGDKFTLAFMDAPYRQGLSEPCLAGLLAGGWLAQGAMVIIEQAKDETPALHPQMEETDRRLFGDTQIGFLRVSI